MFYVPECDQCTRKPRFEKQDMRVDVQIREKYKELAVAKDSRQIGQKYKELAVSKDRWIDWTDI